MICSTGMSSEVIKDTTDLLKDLGAQTFLLHCNSTYPTPFKDVNLSYLPNLKDLVLKLDTQVMKEEGLFLLQQ